MCAEASKRSHWADEVADHVQATGRPAVISTGISPSGEIHLGNMREILTGDAIFRALQERGAPVRFNYVADNFDPLRKVYPFLDPQVYEPWVGRPLSEIPAPDGSETSYSEYYLKPFLAALREMHVDVEVERADAMYKSGRMTPYVIRALEKRDKIAEILNAVTGRRFADDWSPFNVLCPECGRMTETRVVGFDAGEATVDYECGCGSRGTTSIAGGGKLAWNVDWPARWMLLGVTVEPFGKDHSTRGGSYDRGVRLVREVFDGEPPYPVPYEWISLEGGGDMSSSKGNVLSISSTLEVAPPEVLRYFVMRKRPQKRIAFDPGQPLLQLVDEVDDASARGRNERAIELSRAGEFQPVGVPFKHLIVVAQAAAFDEGRIFEILDRTGYAGVSREAVLGRLRYARRWLESFAPQDARFEVQESLPAQAANLGERQRRFLGMLGEQLSQGMDGQAIHELIYRLAGEFDDTKPATLFQAIYLALLGKPKGPRAGSFLAVLGPEFCAERFREAAAGS